MEAKIAHQFFKHHVDFEIHAQTHKWLGFKDDSSRHLWHHVLVFNDFYSDHQKYNQLSYLQISFGNIAQSCFKSFACSMHMTKSDFFKSLSTNMSYFSLNHPMIINNQSQTLSYVLHLEPEIVQVLKSLQLLSLLFESQTKFQSSCCSVLKESP